MVFVIAAQRDYHSWPAKLQHTGSQTGVTSLRPPFLTGPSEPPKSDPWSGGPATQKVAEVWGTGDR